MNDRAAAAQLATVLLGVVAVLLWLEHRAQARLRFALTRSGAASSQDARPLVLQGGLAVLAWCLCAAPVVLGFGVPVLLLGRLLWLEHAYGELGLPLGAFVGWAGNSFALAGAAAVLAAGLALVLASVARAPRAADGWGRAARWASRVVGLGYAIPGGVIAIGILLPLGAVQAVAPHWGIPAWFTGTVLGITLAYLVRFAAVAQQSIDAGFARLPPSLDETARMLGARPGRVFLGVHLPLLQRSVFAAVLLVFVDVMKELPATLVLRPFDTDTLAVVAFNLARDERLGEAALPSAAIVAVGLIPVVMLSRALRRPVH